MEFRSQNKLNLVNLDNANEISVVDKNIIVTYSETDYDSAGEYSTEEKAIKVLDMIEEEYLKYMGTNGGQMATSNVYVQPFSFVHPKVFQMPQDDEVEVKQ